jgi:hypothetical protein
MHGDPPTEQRYGGALHKEDYNKKESKGRKKQGRYPSLIATSRTNF